MTFMMMNNSQLLLEVRHPTPQENLVESIPVEDGTKLSKLDEPWADLRGLGWLVCEDWS